VLECVINVSEGRRAEVLSRIVAVAGPCLLDVHSDAHHNRSVLTLAGDDVEEAARRVAETTVDELDLSSHEGAHPRLGTLDVVPFAPMGATTMADAVAARDAFAEWAGSRLSVPCFKYGAERSLPEVRRGAFATIAPDTGPDRPHPRAGATAVGARPLMVAYNLWLDRAELAVADEIAAGLRGPAVRALAFELDGQVQVSLNLIDPLHIGPEAAYERVDAEVEARGGEIARTELVGLVPRAVLERVPAARWTRLGLSTETTVESRLERAGLPPP
jgi:glutamate formiminotransferase